MGKIKVIYSGVPLAFNKPTQERDNSIFHMISVGRGHWKKGYTYAIDACKILKDNTIQLIHIDGVGHRDFIPLVNWFSFFAKKKIKRRLIRFNLHDLDIQRDYLKELYKLKSN